MSVGLTQKEEIRYLLGRGEWVCGRDLHRVCWRYSARIFDLRRDGLDIQEKPCDCPDGNPHFKHWRTVTDKQPRL